MFEKNYKFHVVSEKKKKVLIDSDVRNEVDDQFAIMLALMTPMFDVQGVIAAHFGEDRVKHSMQESYSELLRLFRMANIPDEVPVAHGCSKKITLSGEKGYFGNKNISCEKSEGVQLILNSVKRLLPNEKLYIAALGPLTDIATAYLVDPAISNRIVVIWNGGADYPDGGMEFNLVNDILAANVVFSSDIEVWQIPTHTYGLPRVSFAELQQKVYPCGDIGQYLFNNVINFCDEMKKNPNWPLPESLDICDLTVIGLLMQEHLGDFEYRMAPFIDQEMFYHNSNNRPIRVYREINYRYILEDFFAKLNINYV